MAASDQKCTDRPSHSSRDIARPNSSIRHPPAVLPYGSVEVSPFRSDAAHARATLGSAVRLSSSDFSNKDKVASHVAPSTRAWLTQVPKIYRDRRSSVASEGHGEAGAEAEFGLCGGRLGASAWLFPQQGQERELCCPSIEAVTASSAPSIGVFRPRAMRGPYVSLKGVTGEKKPCWLFPLSQRSKK